jgi:hypothetical protein
MMKSSLKTLLASLALGSLLTAPVTANAAWGPGEGSFYFNGYHYADSYFKWLNLTGQWKNGVWVDEDPNFEMDIVMSEFFNQSCTGWTDLPFGYDDCPTAGILEGGTTWSFGIGTFHLKKIVVDWMYVATWSFRNTRQSNTAITRLNIQHGWNFCPGRPDTIWCMQANFTHTIREFTAIHGVSEAFSWYHPEW